MRLKSIASTYFSPEEFGIKPAKYLAQLCHTRIGCHFPNSSHFLGASELRYIKGRHIGGNHPICRLHFNGVHVVILDDGLSCMNHFVELWKKTDC